MFKFNKKSLKKFTVISASALMLLSVGGGAVGASHANVHADSALNKIEAESAKDTDADEAQDSQKEAEFDKASGGESAQKLNKQMSKYDKKPATVRKANVKPVKVATKAHKHIVKKHAKRTVRRHRSNRKANTRKVSKAKRQIKRAKRQLNRKNRAKKHVRKHAKRQSLQQQINSLKKEMRSLQRQINRLEAGYRK